MVKHTGDERTGVRGAPAVPGRRTHPQLNEPPDAGVQKFIDLNSRAFRIDDRANDSLSGQFDTGSSPLMTGTASMELLPVNLAEPSHIGASPIVADFGITTV